MADLETAAEHYLSGYDFLSERIISPLTDMKQRLIPDSIEEVHGVVEYAKQYVKTTMFLGYAAIQATKLVVSAPSLIYQRHEFDRAVSESSIDVVAAVGRLSLAREIIAKNTM